MRKTGTEAWGTLLVNGVPAKQLRFCPTLCHPMDCCPPGSSVHGILQARTLEWVAKPSFRGSSQPRDRCCNPASPAASTSQEDSLLLSHQGTQMQTFWLQGLDFNQCLLIISTSSRHHSPILLYLSTQPPLWFHSLWDSLFLEADCQNSLSLKT